MLTDAAITKATKQAAALAKRLDIKDDGEKGLWLRITPKGVRTWSLQAAHRDGKIGRIALGGYPALGLSDARRKARETREALRAGADPTAEKRAARAIGAATRQGVDTLDDILTRYASSTAAPKKSWAKGERAIRRVFAAHLATHGSKLRATALQRTIDDYPSAAMAGLATRSLRPVLKRAARQGLMDKACADLTCQPVGDRDRVLSPHETVRVVEALRASSSMHAKAMLLMLYLGLREEEASALDWTEIQHGALTLAGSRTKNGKPHILILPKQVLALLDSLGREDSGYVFEGRLSNWDRAGKQAMKESGTSGWHRHDLRRTANTYVGALGYGTHITESMLNHTIGSKLAGKYNKARYIHEVGEALQAWADTIDRLIAGDEATYRTLLLGTAQTTHGR